MSEIVSAENVMSVLLHPISVVLISYLLGSLSFAVIVSKFMGLSDPRSYGSKNPGATNVLRSGNKKAAILTLLFDAVKGWVPVFWILQQGGALGLNEGVAAAAGLAAFLGHLYPIFFKFEGGKGVATALGVLMGVSPVLGLAIALTWLGVAWFSKYSSLAALLAAVLAPVYYALASDGWWWSFNGAILGMLCAMGILLVWRHRDNVNRLLAGTESKLGAKKSQTNLAHVDKKAPP
jgi:glycerol-3-phosphate acyltransferase PlsY